MRRLTGLAGVLIASLLVSCTGGGVALPATATPRAVRYTPEPAATLAATVTASAAADRHQEHYYGPALVEELTSSTSAKVTLTNLAPNYWAGKTVLVKFGPLTRGTQKSFTELGVEAGNDVILFFDAKDLDAADNAYRLRAIGPLKAEPAASRAHSGSQ